MEEWTKPGVSVGLAVGISILTALIFGGRAYAYVNNKATKEKQDLNKLQKQIATLEEKQRQLQHRAFQHLRLLTKQQIGRHTQAKTSDI